ncbi:MAG: thioredoxin [Candidatus Melainabacteria bacterium]|nr:thioredoxin [Candidatus Melainabacteria bacterium]
MTGKIATIALAAAVAGSAALIARSETRSETRSGADPGALSALARKAEIQDVNDATFGKAVLKSTSPVLVDFYADWCGPCRAQGPVLERLAGSYEGRVKFVKLNVDMAGKTASKLGVESLPTLMLFDRGKIKSATVGFHDSAAVRELIESNL